MFLTETSSKTNSRVSLAYDPGFTLVELLVVIAIIGILAALLFPAFSRSRQKAQQVYCLSNGRQMMTAMTVYVGDSNDYFPPNPDDGNTVPGHNWCSATPDAVTRRSSIPTCSKTPPQPPCSLSSRQYQRVSLSRG